MKRELIENVRVTPYTSGTAFDREGFLSGVLGVLIGTPSGSPETMQAKVVLTECDTEGGTFTVCKDKLIPVGKGMLDDDGAVAVEVDTAGGSLVNFDLDLLGCKSTSRPPSPSSVLATLPRAVPQPLLWLWATPTRFPSKRQRACCRRCLHNGKGL